MSIQLADGAFTRLLSISFTLRGGIRLRTRKENNSPNDGGQLQAWWMVGDVKRREAVYKFWERFSWRNTTALEGNKECNSYRYVLKVLRQSSCSVSVRQLITYIRVSGPSCSKCRVSYPSVKYYQNLLSYSLDSAIHPLNNWGYRYKHLFIWFSLRLIFLREASESMKRNSLFNE